MTLHRRANSLLRLTALGFAAIACLSFSSFAQNSNKSAELHANGQATAADVGLPTYPGASPYKEPGSDSSSADLGLTLGDFHFRVIAASYKTDDTPQKVLDFYRKPLSRYGDVLECDHGKPIGALKVAHSGLTCSGDSDNHMQAGSSPDSATDHELRAGTPSKFRIVGIGEPVGGSTRFGLVFVELPKDSDSKKQ